MSNEKRIEDLVISNELTVFYTGEVMDNKPHGQGKASYKSGGWYEGEWKNGKREGFGREFYPDETLWYEGEWKEGKRNGAGKSYYTDGKLAYEGEWKNDKPIDYPYHY